MFRVGRLARRCAVVASCVLLAGAADAGRGAAVEPRLSRRRAVGQSRAGKGMVRQDQVAPELPSNSGRPHPGGSPAKTLHRSRFLGTDSEVFICCWLHLPSRRKEAVIQLVVRKAVANFCALLVFPAKAGIHVAADGTLRKAARRRKRLNFATLPNCGSRLSPGKQGGEARNRCVIYRMPIGLQPRRPGPTSRNFPGHCHRCREHRTR